MIFVQSLLWTVESIMKQKTANDHKLTFTQVYKLYLWKKTDEINEKKHEILFHSEGWPDSLSSQD